jgi:hypothetical protein
MFRGNGGGGGGSFGAVANDISSSSSSSSEDPNLSTLVISCEIYEANYRYFGEYPLATLFLTAHYPLSTSHAIMDGTDISL